ncbi:MAG: PfkB family carbohydrate kinase [Pseudomonadota bacterium]
MDEVHVIGSAHWDCVARSDAAPQPGDDLPGRIVRRPGGVAFNIAAGMAEAGLPVELIASIGRDGDGAALIGAIEAGGIGTRYLHRAEATDRYLAIEGPDGALFAAVADCRALDAAGPALLASWRSAVAGAAMVVLDGNLPDSVAAALPFAEAFPREIALVAASPAKATSLHALIAGIEIGAGAGEILVFANLAEAEALCEKRFENSLDASRALAALTGTAVVTAGPAAAAYTSIDGLSHCAVPPARQGSTLGAGDAFVAGFLACRRDPFQGVEAQFQAGFAAAARSMQHPL